MTLSELLHSLTFDEIAVHLPKYDIHPLNFVFYKVLFDHLHHTEPLLEEESNEELLAKMEEMGLQPNEILVNKWEYDEEPDDDEPIDSNVLAAHLAWDKPWHASLAKELKIDQDVEATPAEIAATCLVFLATIEENSPEGHEVMKYDTRKLCEIFHAGRYKTYSHRTFAYDATQRVAYYQELIEQYDLHYSIRLLHDELNITFTHCMIVLSTSSAYPLRMEELNLIPVIAGEREVSCFIKQDDTLGEELGIDIIFY